MNAETPVRPISPRKGNEEKIRAAVGNLFETKSKGGVNYEVLHDIVVVLKPIFDAAVMSNAPWLSTFYRWIAGRIERRLQAETYREFHDALVKEALSPKTAHIDFATLKNVAERLCMEALPFGACSRIYTHLLDDTLAKNRAVIEACDRVGLGRWLEYRRSVLSQRAFGEDSRLASEAARVLSGALRAAIQLLHDFDEWDAEKQKLLLEEIEEVFRIYATDRDATIDSNYMSVRPKNEELLARCRQNGAAMRVFEQTSYDSAKEILIVECSTNDVYRNFWIPIGVDESWMLPGAVEAKWNKSPAVVYATTQAVEVEGELPFGGSIAPALQSRLRLYLQEAQFGTFLSFPVVRDGSVPGVVNVNLASEDLRFYGESIIHQVWHSLSPLLFVLSMRV